MCPKHAGELARRRGSVVVARDEIGTIVSLVCVEPDPDSLPDLVEGADAA
jgi:hypothetical protein